MLFMEIYNLDALFSSYYENVFEVTILVFKLKMPLYKDSVCIKLNISRVQNVRATYNWKGLRVLNKFFI